MATQDVNLTLRKTEGKAFENSVLYFQIFYMFKLRFNSQKIQFKIYLKNAYYSGTKSIKDVPKVPFKSE